MKVRLFLLASFCFFGSFSSIAQQDNDSKKGYQGFRVGWNYSNLFDEGTATYDNLHAFYIGTFHERKVSPLFRVGSGVGYFQNGLSNGDKDYRMHNISVPLYVKAKLGPIYGNGGLALNFKVYDNRNDFPLIISETNFFDMPLFVGLGAELFIFQIEARYHWGLFDIANVDGTPNRTQYFQLGFGVIF